MYIWDITLFSEHIYIYYNRLYRLYFIIVRITPNILNSMKV